MDSNSVPKPENPEQKKDEPDKLENIIEIGELDYVDGEEGESTADQTDKSESDISIQPSIIEDIDFNLKDNEFDFDVIPGVINLAFPENPECGKNFCYPPSYYTVTQKERLLLYFAENFRRQFQDRYPDRRPLVLVVKNECDVQKFVCTTIRPTTFPHIEFIDSIEYCADFVADFIIYEPLANPISLPERLMSPLTLLKRRTGNSFEMATLLCSILIGAGFPAVVVSGVARHETTLNDQRKVICPFIPKPYAEFKDDDEIKEKPTPITDYTIPPLPDLNSHLEDILAKIAEERRIEAERLARQKQHEIDDELGTLSTDKFHNRRTHAWVAIIENAPWSLKKRKKILNEEGAEIDAPPSAIFIEPSTGYIYDVFSNCFIFVESVWNQQNYFVNRQMCRPRFMRWDLGNVEDWEHFLPAEPPELRVIYIGPEDNAADIENNDVRSQKHLDIMGSWVSKLEITERQLENRFPNDEKIIHFKQCVYERNSCYSLPNGRVMRITIFTDDIYRQPSTRWEYFRNRSDNLEKIIVNFETKTVQEYFLKGRPDTLKFYEHSIDINKPKRLIFYYLPRPDALQRMEVFQGRIISYYVDRMDKLYHEEFIFRVKDLVLERIILKYERNKKIEYDKDVEIREINLNKSTISLKFHYNNRMVTRCTRNFVIPPLPAYGQEYIFNPSKTNGHIADPEKLKPTQLELYRLLLSEIRFKDVTLRKFNDKVTNLNAILQCREKEEKLAILKFRIFDTLHNQAAKTNRLKEFEDEEKRLKEVASKDADFLGPYLVLYRGRTLTQAESEAAQNACLNDLKTRFVRLLNALQSKYEDLTAECKALKNFVRKFQSHFDNFDYDRLVNDVKQLELNKRMVQQHLEMAHEEAQRKYEKVKNSLENDERLIWKEDE